MKLITQNRKFIILVWFFLFLLLLYTRFINLSWGLPYAMHPDERNMAWALEKLSPENLFKPDFFAYGQLPLYLGYLIVFIYKALLRRIDQPTNYSEAVISLRLISAFASIINVYVLVKIVKLILDKFYSKLISRYREEKSQLLSIIEKYFIYIFFIFLPFFIQFSHFGTTESLLMLFYILIIFLTLQIIIKKIINSKIIIYISLCCGLAIATKASSIIFLATPILAIVYLKPTGSLPLASKLLRTFFLVIQLITLTLLFSIIFSPYNIISSNEFLGSMRYETDVAFGRYLAFYTRQFDQSIPIIFQFVKIFPYSLGWPNLILFFTGFILLPWNIEINFLRLAFLIYFLPNSFLFTKWTRFMAPIFPLMSTFSIMILIYIARLLFNTINKISKLKSENKHLFNLLNATLIFVFFFLMLIVIIPGIAYISIYKNPDVRFTASEWIYKNIPENAYILAETANVIDIPIPSSSMIKNHTIREKSYRYISFNFYEIDNDLNLKAEMERYLLRADYIFIPSRRIFANHLCDSNKYQNCRYLEKKYPLLNQYYKELFSGTLGFEKVAEFSSFPKINIFGKTIVEFPDEKAEEAWTVFDHPVIRIYKKIDNRKL